MVEVGGLEGWRRVGGRGGVGEGEEGDDGDDKRMGGEVHCYCVHCLCSLVSEIVGFALNRWFYGDP